MEIKPSLKFSRKGCVYLAFRIEGQKVLGLCNITKQTGDIEEIKTNTENTIWEFIRNGEIETLPMTFTDEERAVINNTDYGDYRGHKFQLKEETNGSKIYAERHTDAPSEQKNIGEDRETVLGSKNRNGKQKRNAANGGYLF